MRILLIKTSSMGDIIHTLPALSDARHAFPDIIFDWVIEESFAEIPLWHPAVGEIIPVALRRWRKDIFSRKTWAAMRQLRKRLQQHHYDMVLDAQGLTKSAFLSLFTRGERVGLDFHSAREALASFAYQQKCTVNFYQHAIVRMRNLFSQALGYALPGSLPDFNLDRTQFGGTSQEKYFVFLHGTTWHSKLWPELYWQQLAELAAASGYRIKISGGSDEEIARAKRLAKQVAAVDALPRLDISSMAKLLANATGAVAVDTGFGHLAAALGVPTISLYGSTNPAYTGALGNSSVHLAAKFPCSPCLNRDCTYKKPADVTPACYATLPPALVWEEMKKLIHST